MSSRGMPFVLIGAANCYNRDTLKFKASHGSEIHCKSGDCFAEFVFCICCTFQLTVGRVQHEGIAFFSKLR